MVHTITNTVLFTALLAGSTWLCLGATHAHRPYPLPDVKPPAARATAAEPIIYFFTRSDCIYCRPMRKLADQLHREGHTVYVVNPSRRDLAGKYGVSAYPTFLIVDGKTVIRRVIGLTTKEQVLGNR